jgi:hypothetical protein
VGGGYVSLRQAKEGPGRRTERERHGEKKNIKNEEKSRSESHRLGERDKSGPGRGGTRAFSKFELSSSPPRSDARNVCSRARMCSVSDWSMHVCVRVQKCM